MRIAPPGRRSSTRETSEGFEISIPAKRNILLMLFLAAWLVGWCFGEVFAAHELFLGTDNAPVMFLGAWLIGWTLGGGFALYAWLWMLRGREVVVLRLDTLLTKRDLWGVGRSKEYDLGHIKSVRVAPLSWNPYDWSGAMQFWGIGGGPIAFDYGSQTVRLGSGVDEAEAREIVKELRSRHAFPEAAA
jgi:hypothetical protein